MLSKTIRARRRLRIGEWINLNPQSCLSVVLSLAVVSLLAGCYINPNVRKQKYLESGKRFSDEGKYREAAIQFLNALKVDNNSPDAHYQLAQTYEHLGEPTEARNELARTVRLQPANYKARLDLGILSFATGNTEDAQNQADALLAAQPNNPDVHALLSALAGRQGHKDQALTEIQTALRLDPLRAIFHVDLALLLAQDPGKAAQVENALKQSIVLDPKSLNSRLLLASFYARNNRLSEAEKTGWDAVAVDPKSLVAWDDVAQFIFKQGDSNRAEKVLRQVSSDFADNPLGVRILADYYLESRQLDKAVAELSRLSAKYPQNSSVQKGYIRALLLVGDYSTAQAVISKLMKTGLGDPEVAALNGIVLLNNESPSDAEETLQQSARNFPNDPFIRYWLGKAELAVGKNALAEASFRLAVDLNPSALDAHKELARIAVKRGDMSLLSDVAARTIAAVPHLPDGYLWRAVVEMNRNSLAKAEADLQKALEIDPGNPRAYLKLGKLRFLQKRFHEGIALLEQALKRNPDSVAAMRLIIKFDLDRMQPASALARLNAQIAKCPQNYRFYVLLAQLQIQNKHLEQAAAAAQEAIQLNSSDGDAVRLFAQIEVLRGQTANAIDTWQKWRDAHPGDAGALTILGVLEESRGNADKAETYYKQSLQIQPQQPIAANNLAYQMLQSGDSPVLALALAQTARRGMPDSPTTADTLAWAYYNNGNYEFSRDLLRDAIAADPTCASMQYHLGMVYSKLQDRDNAAIHLRKAISLAQNSQMAKQAKEALQGLG